MNARIKEIELNSDDTVKCFKMADGSTTEGDLYVSAMPGRFFFAGHCLVSCFLHDLVRATILLSQQQLALWKITHACSLLHLLCQPLSCLLKTCS